ncbi:hypothetical protein GCM10027160_37160 [Streptomyces calidiresistens]
MNGREPGPERGGNRAPRTTGHPEDRSLPPSGPEGARPRRKRRCGCRDGVRDGREAVAVEAPAVHGFRNRRRAKG